ncbi:MFS transporter [Modestobacter marinus]|uniref:MFS family permease n=1 Tax=Modestobacter marinus TaxID=477641 RepID=A0A846LKT3_9ACTN|nr:MFS transporter [Modestobacter marinus]NIH67164.1 MFS family permease [Modestobacter marinus]
MPWGRLLRNRDFMLFWSGVILSQIGARATVAASLWQVYELTGSIAMTGLVGGAQAVALVTLSPIGGVLADRWDRRRLLQTTQALAMFGALGMAAVTLSGNVQAWHVLAGVLVTTAAATFDQPCRQALVPALVPREVLPAAIALLNPSREVAVLTGPALGGLLIAVDGPGLVYLLDGFTYAALIGVLAAVRVPPLVRNADGPRPSVGADMAEGIRYVRRRPLIWSLCGLDLVLTVFGAYRVLLPAFSDRLDIGPAGYGLLSAAPSLGALLATYSIVRLVTRSRRLGRVLLVSTVTYGLVAIGFAQVSVVAAVLLLALLLGAFDATATTIRHAAVQLETPDELRGRVQSLYQITSRGGPALGDVVIGAAAGLLGPVTALTAGAAIPVLVGAALLTRTNVVREYAGIAVENEAAPVDEAGTGQPTTDATGAVPESVPPSRPPGSTS